MEISPIGPRTILRGEKAEIQSRPRLLALRTLSPLLSCERGPKIIDYAGTGGPGICAWTGPILVGDIGAPGPRRPPNSRTNNGGLDYLASAILAVSLGSATPRIYLANVPKQLKAAESPGDSVPFLTKSGTPWNFKATAFRVG
jgi:hypothetical protein